MKTRVLKSIAMMAWLLAGWRVALAQPTIAPSAVTFNYQMGATPQILQQKVVATLPAASAGQTLKVSNVVVASSQTVDPATQAVTCVPASDTACGWLSVTPLQGSSPLTLTVTANTTTLTAGSYSGNFTVTTTTAPYNPVPVKVTLSISNPPSKLSVSSDSFPKDASNNPVLSLAFSYTTSDSGPPMPAVIKVGSTGDIIPFSVTVANVTSKGSGSGTVPMWLRVMASGGNNTSSTSASSSAFPGSYVAITVSLDAAAISSLDPAGSPYNANITIAAASAVNGTYTVAVTLNVAAGAPSVFSVFPGQVNAQVTGTTTTSSYIFTLTGDNFFTTTAVSLQQGIPAAPVGSTISLPQPVYLSRQVLQVTVNPAYFTVPQAGGAAVPWFLRIANPAPASNPALPAATVVFYSVDPTTPTVTGVVNAASYQQASLWAGTGTDPLAKTGVSPAAVSPRQIVTIFGQNLGPATASTVQPQPFTCPDGTSVCQTYPTSWPLTGNNIITVYFNYTDAKGISQSVAAPILMTSMNQVNAIVPKELAAVLNQPGQQVSISVTNGYASTQTTFPVTVVAENPGIFTFGGLGQGQGAIINYDGTGTITSVNSAKNQESRGNTIAIYLTGLGLLSDDSSATGDILLASNPLADQNVRVDIGGQPCVVTYAGAAPYSVSGLVQVNAVVTPSAKAGTAVPIVVSIGAQGAARTTQSGVTLGVK